MPRPLAWLALPPQPPEGSSGRGRGGGRELSVMQMRVRDVWEAPVLEMHTPPSCLFQKILCPS